MSSDIFFSIIILFLLCVSVTRFPLGQMPTLEVDGQVIIQSFAIHRYLAEELGFYGESSWDRAIIDQIGETVNELTNSIIPFVYGKKSQEEKVKSYLHHANMQC